MCLREVLFDMTDIFPTLAMFELELALPGTAVQSFLVRAEEMMQA